MAKEVAKREQAGELAQVPEGLIGGADILHDDGGLRLGELKLYQGSATEAAMYGEHPRGTFVDCLEKRAIGPTCRIAFLGGEKVIVKFVEGQKFPVYVYPANERHKVPASDLVDGSGKGGRGTAAREQILGIVIVEGLEFPYLFRFKSTSLAALTKTIQPLEDRRKMTRQVTGLYELYSTDDKGPGGEAFKRLGARPAGDLPESMYDLALKAKMALKEYFAKGREAVAQGEEPGEPGDQSIPI